MHWESKKFTNLLPHRMSYVNLFKAPPPSKTVPKIDDPVDLNFFMPIPSELSSERVKLVPFVVSSIRILMKLKLNPP